MLQMTSTFLNFPNYSEGFVKYGSRYHPAEIVTKVEHCSRTHSLLQHESVGVSRCEHLEVLGTRDPDLRGV